MKSRSRMTKSSKKYKKTKKSKSLSPRRRSTYSPSRTYRSTLIDETPPNLIDFKKLGDQLTSAKNNSHTLTFDAKNTALCVPKKNDQHCAFFKLPVNEHAFDIGVMKQVDELIRTRFRPTDFEIRSDNGDLVADIVSNRPTESHIPSSGRVITDFTEFFKLLRRLHTGIGFARRIEPTLDELNNYLKDGTVPPVRP